MRITIVIAILAFWFFSLPCGFLTFAATKTSSPSATPAQQVAPEAVNIGYSIIDPSSPLYFLKSTKEYIELHFFAPTIDASKVTQKLEFALRRLREVNSLIRDKRQDLIVPMMEQYKNFIDLAGKVAPDRDNIQTLLTEAKARHLDVLMRLYDQIGDPNAKREIRSAIVQVEEGNQQSLAGIQDSVVKANLIMKVAPRQQLACSFLAREANSSALNDTEKYYFSQKAKQCQ